MHTPEYLSMMEVDRAPDTPGLYAWYASPILGEADLVDNDTFLMALNNFTRKLTKQNLDIYARLRFELQWSGTLETAQQAKAYLPEAFSTTDRRELMSLILRAQHIFSHPIYIGKTERSLRIRLREHVDAFMRLVGARDRHGEPLQFTGSDNFAQRAFESGLSQDHLGCYVLSLPLQVDSATTNVDGIVLAAEGFLNQWANPLLGRR